MLEVEQMYPLKKIVKNREKLYFYKAIAGITSS
jgi:hypothetical protein